MSPTNDKHPVSSFSKIHSSNEKDFISINSVIFFSLDRGNALFEKETFVMNRGYDNNKMFQFKSQKTYCYKCIKFLHYLMHGISCTDSHEIRDKCPKGFNLKTANPVKEKVHFRYYQIAKGISGILSYTKKEYKTLVSNKNVRYTVNSV